jgi:hypothetical protein
MTRDEIMKMARQAGVERSCINDEVWMLAMTETSFEKFAALVAEAEAAKWAKGVKISLPTYAMEQQFSWHHRRGYEAGKALIPAAVAAEREACAKVVEASPSYDWHRFACETAAAIRARGEK